MPLAPRAVFDRADVSEHALARLAGFTRMLRDNGFAVGLKESEDAARVLVSNLAGRAADSGPDSTNAKGAPAGAPSCAVVRRLS